MKDEFVAGGIGSPVRKLLAAVGVLQDHIEEVFDRVTHADRREFSVLVTGGANATELEQASALTWVRRQKAHVLQHLRQRASSAVTVTKDE